MREFNAKKKWRSMTPLKINPATKSFPGEIEMKRIGPLLTIFNHDLS